MKVLLATSWDTPCGIADHSAHLKRYVERADPGIEILPRAAALDPAVAQTYTDFDLLHLNHHDALHSRWTAADVQDWTERKGIPVVVTYHDTRERIADCPKLASLAAVASSAIVHEPVEGLRAIYWRQGVPEAATPSPFIFDWTRPPIGYAQRPILGTVGFNFPWKNYDRLCSLTASLGWGLVILATNATLEDEHRWRRLNPLVYVRSGFLPTDLIVRYLAACDATAFMYECANTGTSGAIRLGIAARKRVYALRTCRQFRDLTLDGLGNLVIDWVMDWESLATQLMVHATPQRYHPGISALAHQESWVTLGANYARLYRALAHGVAL